MGAFLKITCLIQNVHENYFYKFEFNSEFDSKEKKYSSNVLNFAQPFCSEKVRKNCENSQKVLFGGRIRKQCVLVYRMWEDNDYKRKHN